MDSSPSTRNKQHKCTVDGCNASFTRLDRLVAHGWRHTGVKPFVCNFADCSKSYSNITHLKRHKCMVHDESYKLAKKSSEELICEVEGCGLVLSNKYSLKKHVNRAHTKTFICSECSAGFPKKSQLNQHSYVHTGEVPFKCISCTMGFYTETEYNKHKRNHKIFTCDCGKIFPRWSLFCKHRKHSCTIKKIDHECAVCNKIFKTKTNLRIHCLVHLSESQKEIYRCPYLNCSRTYNYKKNLNYHVAVFHEKLKDDVKIKCTEAGCEQILKSKKNLRQHLANVHSGVPKVRKPRNSRRDKGKRKKSMAAVLSGVSLTTKEHLSIINSEVKNPEKALVSDETEKYKLVDVQILNEVDPVVSNEITNLSKQSSKEYDGSIDEAKSICMTFEAEDMETQQLESSDTDFMNDYSDIALLEKCNEVLANLQAVEA